VTNQLRRSGVHLIDRYAQRMLIENGIADGADFFHIDALFSAVAMQVGCDLQLTLMASSLSACPASLARNSATASTSSVMTSSTRLPTS
jgi:hypothetical protein